MPARIMIANNCAFPKGYIIQIISDKHKLSKNESKKEWKNAGHLDGDWSGAFLSLIIKDKTVEEMMFLRDKYLFDTGIVPEGEEESIKEARPKYHFSEPDENSKLWDDLDKDGEAKLDYETVMQYIMDLE